MNTFNDVHKNLSDLLLKNETAKYYEDLFKEDLASCSDNFNQIFHKIVEIIEKNELLPQDYLDMYDKRLIYELTMDIYHTTRVSLNAPSASKQRSHSIQEKAGKYVNTIGYGHLNNICSTISKTKPLLQSDCNLYNQISKVNTFFGYMNVKNSLYNYASSSNCDPSKSFFNKYRAWNISKTGITNTENLTEETDKELQTSKYLSDNDFIFYLDNYTRIPYNLRKSSVQIKDFPILISEFLMLHPLKKSFSIEHEYSSFLLEKMCYPIQYQKCLKNYLGMCTTKKLINLDALPFIMYIRLFDTHEISLSDYFVAKYSNIFTNTSEDQEEKLFSFYIDTQSYYEYYLPILRLVLKDCIYSKFDKDLNKLKNSIESFITKLANLSGKDSITYQTMLNQFEMNLKETKYPNGKFVLNEKSARIDSPEYTFNSALTHIFYRTEGYTNYFYTTADYSTFVDRLSRNFGYLASFYKPLKIKDIK